VKGRCIGVSLFHNLLELFYNNKIIKSFPGARIILFCTHTHNKREAPQCTCMKGSITIEASMIIPFFTCFFAAFLFFFRVMQVQLLVQGALEETGRNLAILSVKELEEEVSHIEYLGLAKGMFCMKLLEEELVEQYVEGGAVGVSLLASDFEGDYIALNANYVVDFPVKLLGNLDILVSQNTLFRKWNGWHTIAEGQNAEMWVYVTEHGEVYHMRKSCPYLDLSIRKVFAGTLGSRRNSNGERYRACGRCTMGSYQDMVYITDYGDRYHKTQDCSALKRTIYQKRQSEVGGMDACSKCSK